MGNLLRVLGWVGAGIAIVAIGWKIGTYMMSSGGGSSIKFPGKPNRQKVIDAEDASS